MPFAVVAARTSLVMTTQFAPAAIAGRIAAAGNVPARRLATAAEPPHVPTPFASCGRPLCRRRQIRPPCLASSCLRLPAMPVVARLEQPLQQLLLTKFHRWLVDLAGLILPLNVGQLVADGVLVV